MTIEWNSITRDEADNQLNFLAQGMRTTLPELYVLPQAAAIPHEDFVRRMTERKWGFVLVAGENGAGKSVYIRYVEHIANREGYTIVHVEVNEQQMKQYGPAGYFNRQIVENMRLPDGEMFMFKLQTNGSFRRQIASQLEKDLVTFEFFSPALTQALLAVARDENAERPYGLSWLRGEPKSVVQLRALGIYDRTMKSLLNVPTDRVLFFMKELCGRLGHKGVLVSVDEIERIGDIGGVKGKESLSVLRDLINILTSEDSMPTRRGIPAGTFVCYAISTFFLGYSGIIEVDGVDFRGQADRYRKPKVTLDDIPRLSSVLKNSAATVAVDFDSLEDLTRVAELVQGCYERAHDCRIDAEPAELARAAYDATSTHLARTNIQEIIRQLDDKYSADAVNQGGVHKE